MHVSCHLVGNVLNCPCCLLPALHTPDARQPSVGALREPFPLILPHPALWHPLKFTPVLRLALHRLPLPAFPMQIVPVSHFQHPVITHNLIPAHAEYYPPTHRSENTTGPWIQALWLWATYSKAVKRLGIQIFLRCKTWVTLLRDKIALENVILDSLLYV